MNTANDYSKPIYVKLL